MEVRALIELQKEFDDRHGWNTPAAGDITKVGLMAKDLIGLVGEIGEFANVLKKIQLLESNTSEMVAEFEKRRIELSEEWIDSFIYLLRIGGHLNLDLEQTFLDKLRHNEKKYKPFEKNS